MEYVTWNMAVSSGALTKEGKKMMPSLEQVYCDGTCIAEKMEIHSHLHITYSVLHLINAHP